MSDQIYLFMKNNNYQAMLLPFDLKQLIADWQMVRKKMIRLLDPAFSREEWAYLIQFLDKGNLEYPFQFHFGELIADKTIDWHTVSLFNKPRNPVAVWLPSNVSLLGPLMLILLSLGGIKVWFKGGSKSENLTFHLVQYIFNQFPESSLAMYLKESVQVDFFDRHDPRNAEMAKISNVRIVFGSDDAAQQVHHYDHPLTSRGIYFTDKQSEAWLDCASINPELVETLIKVFAIYGQAGCTSPRRVVMLDGSKQDALALQKEICHMWPKIIKQLPQPHLASANILAGQWAMALNWDVNQVEKNRAVVAVGSFDHQDFHGLMSLKIIPAPLSDAINRLPDHIQTIGYALAEKYSKNCLVIAAETKIKRWIPLGTMHHFSWIWDGYDWWGELFEKVSINQL